MYSGVKEQQQKHSMVFLHAHSNITTKDMQCKHFKAMTWQGDAAVRLKQANFM